MRPQLPDHRLHRLPTLPVRRIINLPNLDPAMAFDHSLNRSSLVSPRRLLAEIRHDLFYTLIDRKVSGLEDLGDSSDGCNWVTCTRDFRKESVIYSAGVGRDISFEHALVDRFGVTIVLLDPSPTALETMTLPQNRRPELKFEALALAGHTGFLDLAPPINPSEGSWISRDPGTVVPSSTGETVSVPCTTLGDLMARHAHKEIDLLKIDIEGAEYGVLESILREGVPIRQIAVEFHNGILPGIPRSRTLGMLMKLFSNGYRIVHKGGSNHTLMRKDLL